MELHIYLYFYWLWPRCPVPVPLPLGSHISLLTNGILLSLLNCFTTTKGAPIPIKKGSPIPIEKGSWYVETLSNSLEMSYVMLCKSKGNIVKTSQPAAGVTWLQSFVFKSPASLLFPRQEPILYTYCTLNSLNKGIWFVTFLYELFLQNK